MQLKKTSKEWYENLDVSMRTNPDGLATKQSTSGKTLHWCKDCHPHGPRWHAHPVKDCKWRKLTLKRREKKSAGQANAATSSGKDEKKKEKENKKSDKVRLEIDRTALNYLDAGDATSFFNEFSHLTSQDFQ